MRKFLVVLVVVALGALWFRTPPVGSVGQTFVFPLSVSGKAIQTDIAFGPGFKPRPGKVNDKILGAILRGENTSDYSVPFIDVLGSDGTGRFYLHFDGRGAD